jgi:hypothetical protein
MLYKSGNSFLKYSYYKEKGFIMRAIEVTGNIDKKGILRLDSPLAMREKKVKVIILLPEENEETEEKLWLSAMTNNPAFDFLHDEQENIYSLKDGKPFQD